MTPQWHVLLVRFEFPSGTRWALPGGGIETGEGSEEVPQHFNPTSAMTPTELESAYDGIRLAGSLAKREGVEVKIFCFGDVVSCAVANQQLDTLGRQGHHLLKELDR